MSAHLAEAVEWFAEHETDRRGVDGTAYEQLKRKFNLTFAEAMEVCRETRKRVGPYPSTGGGIDIQNSKRAQTARAVFLR
ncbi:hypothetical protein [Mesorhizobium sp. WSM4887]|uniref:hypothetical protein n=1 Tax=Mesorhizobium sp. WSM4887 TaxID=3038543 RepID=UPI0024171B92|nr:hypothetical protein [Mesorhizobium sp. WSM4887]MDG4889284.1 hypothetical protein [Mesorhizobium sp. WSM4887]